EEAIAAVQEKIREIRAICGEYLYSEQDEELHEVLGKELIRQSIPTAVCESCTGGMVAAKLVSVPGISSVFDRGLVTYSEKAKQEELGVSGETLARFTAVSEETAREMAEGLAAKTGCRLTIATTGIAGPEADGNRPAGYMFCAVCLDGQTSVRHLNTGRSDRAQNRNLLTLAALDLARRAVQGNV
ncbi:MAG: nicotinamide-nucleotide amidohydrolase family protein, partial [Firmicutes bacterium]|nr:nicotinamide-nucleotide amidohydrolase family protein [Bacillota bacterium]